MWTLCVSLQWVRSALSSVHNKDLCNTYIDQTKVKLVNYTADNHSNIPNALFCINNGCGENTIPALSPAFPLFSHISTPRFTFWLFTYKVMINKQSFKTYSWIRLLRDCWCQWGGVYPFLVRHVIDKIEINVAMWPCLHFSWNTVTITTELPLFLPWATDLNSRYF